MCCIHDTFVLCVIVCGFVWRPSPAQRPEPGQVVRVVDTVADGNDFMEALDLNAEDLHRETRCHYRARNLRAVEEFAQHHLCCLYSQSS